MDEQYIGGSTHDTGSETTERNFSPKLSPREIQQRIRSGESVESLAHAAGTPVEYVARFAAPIQDEMSHLLEIALATPVITAQQESTGSKTFSEVLEERVRIIYDGNPQWSIWKDVVTGKWVLQLTFVADGEDLDARWQYEPRGQYLTPANRIAENLSKISTELEVSENSMSQNTPENVTRFDSAAFKADVTQFDTMELKEPVAYGRSDDNEAVITELYGNPATAAGQSPVVVDKSDEEQTHELLDELSQRRGKRVRQDPLLSIEEYQDIDIELEGFPTQLLDDADLDGPAETADVSDVEQNKPQPTRPRRSSSRKGRQQIPSWDEIVFGAKSEEL